MGVNEALEALRKARTGDKSLLKKLAEEEEAEKDILVEVDEEEFARRSERLDLKGFVRQGKNEVVGRYADQDDDVVGVFDANVLDGRESEGGKGRDAFPRSPRDGHGKSCRIDFGVEQGREDGRRKRGARADLFAATKKARNEETRSNVDISALLVARPKLTLDDADDLLKKMVEDDSVQSRGAVGKVRGSAPNEGRNQRGATTSQRPPPDCPGKEATADTPPVGTTAGEAAVPRWKQRLQLLRQKRLASNIGENPPPPLILEANPTPPSEPDKNGEVRPKDIMGLPASDEPDQAVHLPPSESSKDAAAESRAVSQSKPPDEARISIDHSPDPMEAPMDDDMYAPMVEQSSASAASTYEASVREKREKGDSCKAPELPPLEEEKAPSPSMILGDMQSTSFEMEEKEGMVEEAAGKSIDERYREELTTPFVGKGTFFFLTNVKPIECENTLVLFGLLAASARLTGVSDDACASRAYERAAVVLRNCPRVVFLRPRQQPSAADLDRKEELEKSRVQHKEAFMQINKVLQPHNMTVQSKIRKTLFYAPQAGASSVNSRALYFKVKFIAARSVSTAGGWTWNTWPPPNVFNPSLSSLPNPKSGDSSHHGGNQSGNHGGNQSGNHGGNHGANDGKVFDAVEGYGRSLLETLLLKRRIGVSQWYVLRDYEVVTDVREKARLASTGLVLSLSSYKHIFPLESQQFLRSHFLPPIPPLRLLNIVLKISPAVIAYCICGYTTDDLSSRAASARSSTSVIETNFCFVKGAKMSPSVPARSDPSDEAKDTEKALNAARRALNALVPNKAQRKSILLTRSVKELVGQLASRVAVYDPDVVVSHGLFSSLVVALFDLLAKGQHPAWRHFAKAGQQAGSLPSSYFRMNETDLGTALFAGRLLLDTEKSAQEFLTSLNDYDLASVARSLMPSSQTLASQTSSSSIQAKHTDSNDVARRQASLLSSILPEAQLMQDFARIADQAQDAGGDLRDSWRRVLETLVGETQMTRLAAERMNALNLTGELAGLTGSLWSRSLLSQRAERNEFLILHRLRQQKAILPVPRSQQIRDRMERDRGAKIRGLIDTAAAADSASNSSTTGPAYQGGLVFEPVQGLHSNFVLYLDFASLYPSIIREFEVDFNWTEVLQERNRQRALRKSTAKLEPSCKLEEPKNIEYIENNENAGNDENSKLKACDNVDRAMVKQHDDSLSMETDEDLSFLEVIKDRSRRLKLFGLADGEEGGPSCLPVLLADLVGKRRSIKAAMASCGDKGEKYAMLDIKQRAVKLVANSLYGSLGFSRFRFFSPEIAAAITGLGRQILMETRQLLEVQTHCRVLYGDTDSLMVDTGLSSNTSSVREYSECLEQAQRMLAAVNKNYNNLELELEAVFKGLLLLTKKRYAALKVDDFCKKKFSLEVKGLDLVRRDWCRLSKDLGLRVLRLLFFPSPVPSTASSLQESGQEQTANGVPFLSAQILQLFRHVSRLMDACADTRALGKDVRMMEGGDVGSMEVVDGVEPLALKSGDSLAELKVDLSSFVIYKCLVKMPTAYTDAKSQPHVQVALRMKSRGLKIYAGLTIPYVICEGPGPIAMRARHPHEFRTAQAGELKVDLQYYRTVQILPPLLRLTLHLPGVTHQNLAEALGCPPNAHAISVGSGGFAGLSADGMEEQGQGFLLPPRYADYSALWLQLTKQKDCAVMTEAEGVVGGEGGERGVSAGFGLQLCCGTCDSPFSADCQRAYFAGGKDVPLAKGERVDDVKSEVVKETEGKSQDGGVGVDRRLVCDACKAQGGVTELCDSLFRALAAAYLEKMKFGVRCLACGTQQAFARVCADCKSKKLELANAKPSFDHMVARGKKVVVSCQAVVRQRISQLKQAIESNDNADEAMEGLDESDAGAEILDSLILQDKSLHALFSARKSLRAAQEDLRQLEHASTRLERLRPEKYFPAPHFMQTFRLIMGHPRTAQSAGSLKKRIPL